MTYPIGVIYVLYSTKYCCVAQILDSLLEVGGISVNIFAGSVTAETIERITDIARLMSAVLTSDPSTTSMFKDPAEIFISVIQRFVHICCALIKACDISTSTCIVISAISKSFLFWWYN